jgi:hypothetical protein
MGSDGLDIYEINVRNRILEKKSDKTGLFIHPIPEIP